MKSFTNINKLKAFIAPKITELITFLDSNRKYEIYTEEKFMYSIVI